MFMGKVLKPVRYDDQRFMHWEIEVSRVWKGEVASKTELISDRADNMETLSYCMPEFPVGKTFMFFVAKNKQGNFETIPCSLTRSHADWVSLLKQNPKDARFWKQRGNGQKPGTIKK